MKIFPAVHYSMGGLWADYERTAAGGLVPGSPRNQQTNIPGLYAMGECDYQYHGANRLGANSLLSCIFSGLFAAPGIEKSLASLKDSASDEKYDQLLRGQRAVKQMEHEALLNRTGGRENPYLIHQQLGDVMTKAATVVRENGQLRDAIEKVNELAVRVENCSLSDTGNWTNQNVVFTKSLRDMFPLAKAILKGALARDECRGAHYKPAFDMPGIDPDVDPAEKRRQAEAWCDSFQEKNRKWLKTTIAEVDAQGEPHLRYEDVDTTLVPPRPRLYGLVGAEAIEEVWREREAKRGAAAPKATSAPQPVGAT
jgi:succinate dehydrogenase / fumarate reductase, flavoprotein subunit